MTTETEVDPRTVKIRVEYEVSWQAMASLLTTALEGGIGYWSQAANIKRDADLYVQSVDLHVYDMDVDSLQPPDGVAYLAKDVATKSGGTRLVVAGVTPAVVGTGLLRMFALGQEKPHWHVFCQARDLLAQGELEAGDADVADAAVQLGLWNEVIFG